MRDIEGWRVHVEPALLDGAHREEGAKALAMLAKIWAGPKETKEVNKKGK